MADKITIYFERADDGSWFAIFEDDYSNMGHGETKYEALESLVIRLEDVFEEAVE